METPQLVAPEMTKVLYELARKHGLDIDGPEQEQIRLTRGEGSAIMDLVIKTEGDLGPGMYAGTVFEQHGDQVADALRYYWRTPEGLVPHKILVELAGISSTFYPITGRGEHGGILLEDPDLFDEELDGDAERAQMWRNRYGDAELVP